MELTDNLKNFLIVYIILRFLQLRLHNPKKNMSNGNRPLEPKAWEVEFFPMEEVLYEEIEI